MDYPELTSWDEVQKAAQSTSWGIFYLSLPDCGVCGALKPKVFQLSEDYKIPFWFVDLNKVPEAGGQWSVFTIPGVLVYAQGRESWRGARFIDLRDLEAHISRLQEFMPASS